MAKSIQQRIIEKTIMNFVDAASKRAAKVFTDKTEAQVRKYQDKKNAKKIDDQDASGEKEVID